MDSERISEIFDEKYSTFIASSGYYKTALHQRRCPICRLPKKIREKINSMLLNGVDYSAIEMYLVEQFPGVFNTRRAKGQIDAHKNYLPFIVDDIMVKSIFKRARAIVENKDIESMTDDEKIRAITDIEEELIKEYADLEGDRLSMINVLFKEILPMMISRLQNEIIGGTTKGIKEVADASNVMFKLSTAMASFGAISDEKSDEDSGKVDFDSLDEDLNNSIKGKVVSLRANIDKAIGGTGS